MAKATVTVTATALTIATQNTSFPKCSTAITDEICFYASTAYISAYSKQTCSLSHLVPITVSISLAHHIYFSRSSTIFISPALHPSIYICIIIFLVLPPTHSNSLLLNVFIFLKAEERISSSLIINCLPSC